MRIHAIQTGVVTIRHNQRQGKGRGIGRMVNVLTDRENTPPLPIFAWVIEHPEGIIVIDTGETARTSEKGYFPAWHPYFKTIRAEVKTNEEIGGQLRSLGISPTDVRWVIMTHLHTDHAGGLHHFPKSEILVSPKEYKVSRGLIGQLRGYLPQHMPEWFKPKLVEYHPRQVGAFPESFSLTRAGDVWIVPTPGHTDGHQSVILQDGDLTFFFAGDTSYTEDLMLKQQMDGVTLNENVGQETMRRVLQQLKVSPTVYLPSHDPDSAKRIHTRQPAAV